MKEFKLRDGLCQFFPILLGIVLHNSVYGEVQPSWWFHQGAVAADPANIENTAPANQGQLKNFGVSAQRELNLYLPGGAGPAIDALVLSYRSGKQNRNYALALQGQAKNTAQKFYNRLAEVGYARPVGEFGSTPAAYPWTFSSQSSAHKSPVRIGSVKNLFNFELNIDIDRDGLPDWWEVAYFSKDIPNGSQWYYSDLFYGANQLTQETLNGILALSGGADSNDGDEYSNLEEFYGQSDPNDSGSDPTATATNPSIILITQAEKSRFLMQATFGPTKKELGAVAPAGGVAYPGSYGPGIDLNVEQWLADQFSQPFYHLTEPWALDLINMERNGDIFNPNEDLPPSNWLRHPSLNEDGTTEDWAEAWSHHTVLPDMLDSENFTYHPQHIRERFYYAVIQEDDQLRNRVALALSHILVVSTEDGDFFEWAIPGVLDYFDVLRKHSFGNYRDLLKEVTRHPIMGLYLDMLGSDKDMPNENYARELLQLFTLGVDRLHMDGSPVREGSETLASYTDHNSSNPTTAGDIQQLARILTGWSFDHSDGWRSGNLGAVSRVTQNIHKDHKSNYHKPMKVFSSHHDYSEKFFLGKNFPNQTGIQDETTAEAELDTAIDHICSQAGMAPFICGQLIQNLVTSNPSPGYIYRVSRVFRDNITAGNQLELVIRAILTDREARDPEMSRDRTYGKLREPLIRLLHVMRALEWKGTLTYEQNLAPGPAGNWHRELQRRILTDENALMLKTGQAFLRAPTVFGFFRPEYTDSGMIPETGGRSLESEGLVSPVFGIASEANVMGWHDQHARGLGHSYLFGNFSFAPLRWSTHPALVRENNPFPPVSGRPLGAEDDDYGYRVRVPPVGWPSVSTTVYASEPEISGYTLDTKTGMVAQQTHEERLFLEADGTTLTAETIEKGIDHFALIFTADRLSEEARASIKDALYNIRNSEGFGAGSQNMGSNVGNVQSLRAVSYALYPILISPESAIQK